MSDQSVNQIAAQALGSDYTLYNVGQYYRQNAAAMQAQSVSPAEYACDTPFSETPFSWQRLAQKQAQSIIALEAEVARLTAMLAAPVVTKPGIPARALFCQTMRIGLRT